MGGERRRARRARFVNGHLPPAAKVRPGLEVVLVDLSQTGALFESPFRFRPGHRCDLQIGAPPAPLLVRVRVERCFVARFDSASIRYRTAVSFEVRVSMDDSSDLLAEYRIPGD